MASLKKLIENVWFLHGHLTKKAYTTGMIVFSGLVAVAVMFIGMNGFAVAKDVTNIPTYDIAEDDKEEVAEVETMVQETQSEESLQQYTEWAQAYRKSLEEAEAARIAKEAQATLMQEETIEKNLRTSGNVDEEAATLLNMEDYTALLRIVEAEATSEDLKGKVLIANVVMNRMESKRFPNTIYDVVHQKLGNKAQFSPIDDGRYYTVGITKSTIEAVELALNGTDYSDGALFFVAKSLTSERAGSWFDNNLEFVFKHGVHSFYKY